MLVTRMPGRSHAGPLPPLDEDGARTRDRLRVHVEVLAEHIGERNVARWPALCAAAHYIDGALDDGGYAVTRQTFTAWGKEVCNLEATTAGGDLAGEAVVVGAHYDSVLGSPGANDNGTGVAALIEIARALRARTCRRAVRFVAFVNEEPPFSFTDEMGSRRYAEAARRRRDRIVAMLSLETIGYYSDAPGSQRYPFPFGLLYPDTGNFVGFVGNLRSRALVREAVRSFRAHATMPSEGVAAPGWVTGIGWSDHASFWRAGYRAIMVTDTALFRYPQYHTGADRAAIVDYGRLARVTQGLVHVVADLAGARVTH